MNPDEIRFTMSLVKYIAQVAAGSARTFKKSLGGKIAIITPYKAQV